MIYGLRGFPERLYKAIDGSGFNPCQVARSIGAEKSAVYRWLGGVNMPNTYYLAKICKTCRVSADWLLFGEEK